jgi:phosphocarrier protein HPr
VIVKMVKLLSISDVQNFVNAACAADYDIDLVSGRYRVNAKSIMGIFSLDLTKPIEVHIHAENEEGAGEFLDSIKSFTL